METFYTILSSLPFILLMSASLLLYIKARKHLKDKVERKAFITIGFASIGFFFGPLLGIQAVIYEYNHPQISPYAWLVTFALITKAIIVLAKGGMAYLTFSRVKELINILLRGKYEDYIAFTAKHKDN